MRSKGWLSAAAGLIALSLLTAVAVAADGAPDVLLRQGDRGDNVRRLQSALKESGYGPGSVDGIFGGATTAAVRRLQRDYGLRADGVYGARTRAVLQNALDKARTLVHEVARGETLNMIASRYGVRASDVAKANGLSNPNLLRVGQRITIPGSLQPQRPAENTAGGSPSTGSTTKPSTDPVEDPGSTLTVISGGSDAPGDEPTAVPDNVKDAPRVALTFNDGPAPTTTAAILDALKAADARATFFVNGSDAVRHAAIVRRMAAEGHQVENHGLSHADLTSLSRTAVRREVKAGADVVEELTGRRPRLFRPPFAHYDELVLESVEAEGHRIVLWTSIGLRDDRMGPPELVQRAVRLSYDGAILMLHATSAATAEALPDILERLASRGFRFITLDEMLGGG